MPQPTSIKSLHIFSSSLASFLSRKLHSLILSFPCDFPFCCFLGSSIQTKFVLTTESVVKGGSFRVREAVRFEVPLLHPSFIAAYAEGGVTNIGPWIISPPVRSSLLALHTPRNRNSVVWQPYQCFSHRGNGVIALIDQCPRTSFNSPRLLTRPSSCQCKRQSAWSSPSLWLLTRSSPINTECSFVTNFRTCVSPSK